MLTEIKVTNFAIIDQIRVHFRPGFNVLSGETGSGKSVILKSLALLMGEKSAADFIKAQEPQATVEGAFDLSDRSDIRERLSSLGLESSDDTLVVRRIISKDGKNRVYINGSIATLAQLKELVSPLLEVTGRVGDEGLPLSPLIEMTAQHENRNLQSKAYHLDLLDQYLGLLKERQLLAGTYYQLQTMKQQLDELQQGARDKAQRLDFLRYQRDEILSIDLKENEIVEIENQVELMRNTEKLLTFFDSSEAGLYSDEDSALVRLHRVLQTASEFSKLNPTLGKWAENLQQAKTILEESVYDLRSFNKDLGLDNAESMESVEKRLSDLRKIQKKYGQSFEEIMTALNEFESEIEKLENSEILMGDLTENITAVSEKLIKQAKVLHDKRSKGLKTLVASVQGELKDLNMKGLIFGVHAEVLPEPGPTGSTDIEFTIQTSEKDTARPLAKFASGGELSRILLSLKRVVGQSDEARTYLFDEVDAGVSGVTAEKIGRKLKSISKSGQVICVTHLPQVAAFADNHFIITKKVSKNSVSMSVDPLDGPHRIEELARMISGEKITKTSLAHAKELIQSSEK